MLPDEISKLSIIFHYPIYEILRYLFFQGTSNAKCFRPKITFSSLAWRNYHSMFHLFIFCFWCFFSQWRTFDIIDYQIFFIFWLDVNVFIIFFGLFFFFFNFDDFKFFLFIFITLNIIIFIFFYRFFNFF